MHITLNQQEVKFELRVSPRARGVYLKISLEEGLEVVIPRYYDMRRVPNILQKKARWILRNLEKISKQRQHRQLFGDGMGISILGQTKKLRLLQDVKMPIEETVDTIIMGEPKGIAVARARLERYMRLKAQHFFNERVREWSMVMETRFRKLSVRAQKSRWGSCNRHDDISLNWRLLLLPIEVVDYVIIHELAHTFHHNHSKKFYVVLEKFCPDYKKRRKVLSEMQNILPL